MRDHNDHNQATKPEPRALTDDELRQAAGAGIDIWEGIQIGAAAVGTGAACTTVATGVGATVCLAGWAGTSGMVGDHASD